MEVINQIPWEAIAGLLGITGLVSLVLQKVKKWFSVQSDKVVVVLLGVLSFIPALLDYLNSAVAENPLVLGRNTAVIMGLSQPLYRFVVKPATNLLLDAKAERARRNQAVTVAPTGDDVIGLAAVDASADQLIDIDSVVPEPATAEFPS